MLKIYCQKFANKGLPFITFADFCSVNVHCGLFQVTIMSSTCPQKFLEMFTIVSCETVKTGSSMPLLPWMSLCQTRFIKQFIKLKK